MTVKTGSSGGSGGGPRFPFNDPAGWNLDIGGLLFVSNAGEPGSVRVTLDGFAASWKFDEQDAQGQSGATLKSQGYKLPRGTITVECWDDAGWQFLQKAMAVLRPKKGAATPTAFDVHHPALQSLDVTKIFITEVSAPKWGSQMLSVVFTAIEFAPPPKSKKSVTTPLKIGDIPDSYSGSKPSGGVPFGPPAPPSKTPPTPK